LNNITKTINDTLTYVIRSTRTTLIYHNKNRTAQFYLPDKIIAITDGIVEINVRFAWSKIGQNQTNGTGIISGYSKEIGIAFRFSEGESNPRKYEVTN
jgi:hypothetical protein